MELGPRTEEIVLKLIDEVVPASERHRLWLHGSPPCQSQSLLRQLGAASSATGRQTFAAINQKNNPLSEVDRIEGRRAYDEEFQSNKKTGLELVKWTIDLIVKVNPAQFSIEEVVDRKGDVMALMQEAKRNHPDLFDCVAVQMAEYGVPHFRERAIAARPATIHALRNRASLRARPPTVREMLHETLEPELVYVYGTVTRAIAPKGTMDHKVRPRPISNRGLDTQSLFTDGLVNIATLDRPATTVCTKPFPFADKDYRIVRYAKADEVRKITTFPDEMKWPNKATETQKCKGYGNAIPPLFVQAMFRAASAE